MRLLEGQEFGGSNPLAPTIRVWGNLVNPPRSGRGFELVFRFHIFTLYYYREQKR